MLISREQLAITERAIAATGDRPAHIFRRFRFDGALQRDIAAEMVHDALTAYAARDAALARQVIATDEKVDNFYESIFRNLVSHMVENPATISSAAQLLFVARNIERIGDHATNVAEMVHYAATGSYPADVDA